jgi:hypothetical protein
MFDHAFDLGIRSDVDLIINALVRMRQGGVELN